MLHTIDDVKLFFHERDQLGIKPGLERVGYLLQGMRHPERNIRTIHVAGTNGKGSTIQFINEALRANHYTVGVFTSPSFTGIGGHFFVNGIQASDELVIKLVNRLMPSIKELDLLDDSPTSFEIITVMAFVCFSDTVDVAVIETGMGGRFDTTNCFIPEVAVITNISLDHMHFLGDNLADIAWHKAGIMKDKVPVVLGRIKDTKSLEVFEEESTKKHAPLYQLGKDFHYTNESNNQLDWFGHDMEKHSLSFKMKGKHQADNLAVAYMVLQILKEQGMPLTMGQIKKGIQNAVLPGRFEVIHSDPVIVLDSAHNAEGMKAFTNTLDDMYPEYRKIVLFAGFKDKQLDEMLHILQQHVDEMILTTFEHPRAADLGMLKNIQLDIQKSTTLYWEQTVISFMYRKTQQKTVFCITGSLHFITEVRSFILRENVQNL